MSVFQSIKRAFTPDPDVVRTPYRMDVRPQSIRAAAGQQVVPAWQIDQPQWSEFDAYRADRKAYRGDALIYACIRLMAEGISAAPMRVREQTSPGEYDWDESRDIARVLKTPNVVMGQAEFFDFCVTMAAIAGYCVVEKERDSMGRVVQLWPLRPDWLKAIPRSDGMTDWEYWLQGKSEYKRVLKGEDTIDFRWSPTTDRRAVGLSPLQVIWQSVDTGLSLANFLKSFIDRGAMPMYFAVLNTDGDIGQQWSNPSTVEAFRQRYRDIYRGQDVDEILVSPAVKDIKPMGFDMNQLAFTDLYARLEATVCQAFGIPPILVQSQLGIEKSTYTNFEQSRRAFHESKLTTLWGRIDDAFTRQLLPEFDNGRTDLDLVFDTSALPAFKDDEDAIWARATAALAAGGISTHAFQRKVGMPEQGADVFLRSFGTVEVDATATAARVPEASVRMEQRAALPDGREVKATAINQGAQDGGIAWWDATFPEYAGLLDGRNGWSYDERSFAYVNEDRREVTQAEMVVLRNEAADALGLRLSQIVGDDATQNERGLDLLMAAIIAVYLLGRGGTGSLDAADNSAITRFVLNQTAYWTNFMNDIETGKTTVAQALARAQLYGGGAIVPTFSVAQATAWGADRALPYWPADAGTLCKSSCRCYWSYEQFEDGTRSAWWNDVHDGQPPECAVCWRRSGEYPQTAPFHIRDADPSGETWPRVSAVLR